MQRYVTHISGSLTVFRFSSDLFNGNRIMMANVVADDHDSVYSRRCAHNNFLQLDETTAKQQQ